jgi:electron transfer flavoprotein alpha subunit
MMVAGGILVVAEQAAGKLREATCEVVSAAVALGQAVGEPVAVAVLGPDADSLGLAANLEGVDEVLLVSTPSFEFESDTWRQVCGALIASRQPAVVLTSHSVNAFAWAPAVAAEHGLGFSSDVVSLRADADGVVAVREPFAGKVRVEVGFAGQAPLILLLRSGMWPAATTPGSAHLSAVEVAVDASRVRTCHEGFEEAPPSGLDLAKAPFILSIGRGIEDRDNVQLFSDLADKFGAVLASSRPLVDAGWLESARQVGQSGATVKPAVYLAFGISGSTEHLAGMRQSGLIIAVNTDPRAPIFNVAHFGAVVDAMQVAEELHDLL